MLNDMKNILFRDFSKFYMELKDIAYNSTNDEYPVYLKNRMFNLDVMANSIYGLSQELMPYSPDAFYVDDKIYFIEFKNGKLDTADKKRSLRLKFIEGPYIILPEF